MAPPNFLQDQNAQLQGRLQAVNDRIVQKQSELQQLLDERTAIRQSITDLQAAYQAWKGGPP